MRHTARAMMASLLMTAAVPPALHAADIAGFAGQYRMSGKGFGPADRPYEGTCSLVARGGAYDVSCFNRDTRHTYVGRGLEMADTLSVYIGDHLRGDHNEWFAMEYLVVYRRRSDGVLEGTWLHATSAAAGSETLTPIRP